MFYPDLSTNTKKVLLLVLSALFAYWLLFTPVTCAASGMQETDSKPAITYQITDSELTQLEMRLEMLDQLLAQQNPELTTLQLQLAESKRELATLRKELTTSKEQLLRAENSLQNANRSLQQYAAEVKRERLRLKAQRNTWECVSAVLAVVAVIK